MIDLDTTRPWFRRRALGMAGTPITWEGWVAPLFLVLLVLATTALADPRDAAGPTSLILLRRVKALLGLTQVRLGIAQVLLIMAAEVAVFAILVRSKTESANSP